MLARALWLLLPLAVVSCRTDSRAQLPALGRVTSFALQDQSAAPVSDASLRGQVWAAAFLFTRCPTVCPRMMAAMREVDQEAQARGIPLRLVAFSLDAEHDTPPVLTAFAQKHSVDLRRFSLLTGDPTVIERAAEGFKIGVEGRADAGADHFGILHGSHLALVDRAGEVRGYYRVLDPDGRRELLTSAVTLAR